MTVYVHGGATVFVDGAEYPAPVVAVDARGVRTVAVDLRAGGPSGPRPCGSGPVPGSRGAPRRPTRCCEAGPGRIRVGDRETHGLAEYSGGVRYRRVVTLPAEAATGRVRLDLGRIRGTAEV
ncbi:hypothetical protein OG936_02770 [Streptomyces sp. NBC_00846]|uniref:hypothetical protein n=1 Tax=Streptomyces sp. NBC_00846 TaxID=2975849 RepID=UPI00386F75DE|nr:hypothetical protein OG936_02770 [Streptomyces sp. NBC_00846]